MTPNQQIEKFKEIFKVSTVVRRGFNCLFCGNLINYNQRHNCQNISILYSFDSFIIDLNPSGSLEFDLMIDLLAKDYQSFVLFYHGGGKLHYIDTIEWLLDENLKPQTVADKLKLYSALL